MQPSDPIEQLRDALAASKREGVEFALAWEGALGEIDWAGSSGRNRAEAEDALRWSRDFWRNAYEDTSDGVRAKLDALFLPSDHYEANGINREPMGARGVGI